MQLVFKIFESSDKSWSTLFAEAAAFATQLGPDRLVSISHSAQGGQILAHGVVTVWYWTEPKVSAAK